MTSVVQFPRKDADFKIGDVVTLKSGGPACLVIKAGTKFTTYACFDKKGKSEPEVSPNVCLQLLYPAPFCDENGFWSNCLKA